MAGMILWRVKGTWANKGRTGEIDEFVEAVNAIEAIEIAWQVENPNDLRTVSVEWLCPVSCILRELQEAASESERKRCSPTEIANNGIDSGFPVGATLVGQRE